MDDVVTTGVVVPGPDGRVVYRLSWTMPARDPHQPDAGLVPTRFNRIDTEDAGILTQARRLHQWSVDGTEPISDVVLEGLLPDGTWRELPLTVLTEPEVD